MADILDELIGGGVAPQELVKALRSQVEFGTAGALSGSKRLAPIGAGLRSEALESATGLRTAADKRAANKAANALEDLKMRMAASERAADREQRAKDAAASRALQRELQQMRGTQAKELAALKGKAGGAATKGTDALDRAFAKEYVGLVSGGIADAQKGIQDLKDVQARLSSGKENLTGPMLGTLPDFVRDITNPRSSDVQNVIESTIQRSLRPILGAQFTQQEGERLIARAYNPRQPEPVNAARVSRLLAQMEAALQNKLAAAQYFEQNGTLRGFEGKYDFTGSDFNPDVDMAELPAGESAPVDDGFDDLIRQMIEENPDLADELESLGG